jgi:hypothetical protein
VNDESRREADVARDALSEMQESLDCARRLVERTRFLLTGEATPSETGLTEAGLTETGLTVGGDPQAAAPNTSETVQKPSGE